MMGKTIKNTFLAVIVTAVLCVGTVSARQLRNDAKGFACGTTCSIKKGCATNCFCILGSNGTGVCSGNPQLSQKPGK